MIVLLFSIHLATLATGQAIEFGSATNVKTGKESEVLFKTKKEVKNSTFTTHYEIISVDRSFPLAGVIASYDTVSRRILIQQKFLKGKDTTARETMLNYNTQLGLVFTLDGPVTEMIDSTKNVLLSLSDPEENFIHVLQIVTSYKSTFLRYRFEDIRLELLLPEKMEEPLKSESEKANQNSDITPKAVSNVNLKEKSQYYFFADSIETILKPVKSEVVFITFLFKGGVSNYKTTQQGIEWLALNTAVYGGTRTMDAQQLAAWRQLHNIRVTLQPSYDHTLLSLEFPLTSWDPVWKLINETLVKPTFSRDEFELLRNEMLSYSHEFNVTNPRAANDAVRIGFKNKMLDKNPYGSTTSLDGISFEDMKRFYSAYMSRSRIVLSITGNIQPDVVKKKIRTSLRELPLGFYGDYPISQLPGTATFTLVSDKQVAGKNTVTIMTDAPRAYTQEYTAFILTMKLLEERLNTMYDNRKLSSSISTYVSGGSQPFGIIQLTTQNPDRAMQVLIDELKRLKKHGFPIDQSEDFKEKYLVDTYLHFLDHPETLSNALAVYCYHNRQDYLDKLPTAVNKIQLDKLHENIKKYLRVFTVFYHGSPADANPIIYTQRTE